MTPEQAFTLIGTLTLAILSPGPAIIAAMQAAMAHGRARALPYGLGLATGAALWCLFALAGLAVLFRAYPPIYGAMRLLGGLYLIWFAWNLWRGARDPLPEAEGGVPRGFWGGIALNLSNPKPALFYGAVILSIFPGVLTLSQKAGIYAVALGTELFWYVVVVFLASTAVMRARYFAAKLWIDRAAALALLGLGVLLILGH